MMNDTFQCIPVDCTTNVFDPDEFAEYVKTLPLPRRLLHPPKIKILVMYKDDYMPERWVKYGAWFKRNVPWIAKHT